MPRLSRRVPRKRAKQGALRRKWSRLLTDVITHMFSKNRGSHIGFRRRSSFSVKKLCTVIKRNPSLLKRYVELCRLEGIAEAEAVERMQYIIRAKLYSLYMVGCSPIADLVREVLRKGYVTKEEWETMLASTSESNHKICLSAEDTIHDDHG